MDYDGIKNGKEKRIMEKWEKEISILGDDFCINRKIVHESIREAKRISTPKGKDENIFRYESARKLLMPIIMTM